MSRKSNAYMGDVDILWPELLCQALRKSPHPKLTRGESAGCDVAPKGCRGTCEDESASLSSGFLKLLVISEREDRTTRERKGRSNGRLEAVLNVLRCDFEERLPNTMSNVEHGRTDGVFRFGEMCVDGTPCRCYVFVRIRRESKRCRLFNFKVGVIKVNDRKATYMTTCGIYFCRKVVHDVCSSGDECHTVAIFGE